MKLPHKYIFRKGAILLTALLLAAQFSACNLPGRSKPTSSSVELIYTAAAQTVQAQSIRPTSTLAPLPPTATGMPIITPGVTLQATSTTAAQPSTPAPTPCDRVKFVTDVTIPDDTSIDPGATVVKTWRLQNAGSCTWNSAYTLVVEGDNVFKAPTVTPITSGTVPPGGIIDISVTLSAPSLAGTYRGNFKLANAAGQRFGLGSNGSNPFWAQVKISIPAGISLDFIARASQAEWRSSAPNNLDTLLAFGGADDDANGVAKIKEGARLENGASSGKVLLTFPKHIDHGAVQGIFPAYTVQPGDHLRVRLGFLANTTGSCGVGQVTFQIGYYEGTASQLLGEWNKICDGRLLPVDIDLSNLKGRTVQIIFLVKTNGSFADDWAIWNSPRIER